MARIREEEEMKKMFHPSINKSDLSGKNKRFVGTYASTFVHGAFSRDFDAGSLMKHDEDRLKAYASDLSSRKSPRNQLSKSPNNMFDVPGASNKSSFVVVSKS